MRFSQMEGRMANIPGGPGKPTGSICPYRRQVPFSMKRRHTQNEGEIALYHFLAPWVIRVSIRNRPPCSISCAPLVQYHTEAMESWQERCEITHWDNAEEKRHINIKTYFIQRILFSVQTIPHFPHHLYLRSIHFSYCIFSVAYKQTYTVMISGCC